MPADNCRGQLSVYMAEIVSRPALCVARGVSGCCPSRTIPPSAFGSHLPLHKGGMVGSPFVRWVTVEFVDTVYFAKSICLTCLANQTRYAKAEPLLDISVLRRIRYVLPRAKRESDMSCRGKGIAHSVGDRIISRFCCFSAGASPRPTDWVKIRSFGE